MRNWIVRHPVIFCLTLFGLIMLGLRFAARWFVYDYGATWLEVIAVVGVMIFLGCLWERRDRQRDNAR